MLAVFWLFECVGLDVVVLEVGLGGCLDVVNLVVVDVFEGLLLWYSCVSLVKSIKKV